MVFAFSGSSCLLSRRGDRLWKKATRRWRPFSAPSWSRLARPTALYLTRRCESYAVYHRLYPESLIHKRLAHRKILKINLWLIKFRRSSEANYEWLLTDESLAKRLNSWDQQWQTITNAAIQKDFSFSLLRHWVHMGKPQLLCDPISFQSRRINGHIWK